MSEVTFSNSSFSQKVMLAERWFRSTSAHDVAEKVFDGGWGAPRSSGSSESGEKSKASRDSLKVRYTNDPERLQQMYEASRAKTSEHAQLDSVHDSLALSPAALAFLG